MQQDRQWIFNDIVWCPKGSCCWTMSCRKIHNSWCETIVCLWHITLLKNHLDSCTNASKTLSPSLELVSKNVALCSRASFSPFSEVTHLHPWSMRSERKSSLLPHNMIGILFSDTSCKNDKKYIFKKNSWNWNPSHLGPPIRMTYSRTRYWFKDFDSIPRRNG